jgi:hypothetical protein
MRAIAKFGTAIAIGVAVQLIAATGSRGEIEYPYCQGVGGGRGAGFVTCGFATMAQCRETTMGMGGWCQPNPYYVAGPTAAAEGRARRGARRQSGS